MNTPPYHSRKAITLLAVLSLLLVTVTPSITASAYNGEATYIKVIPSTPSSLEPVIVEVRYEEKPNLYTYILVDVNIEIYYNVGIRSSSGAVTLTINVTRHGAPLGNAYVVLYGPLGSIYGSGYTDSTGKIVFKVNPGDYIVRAFYDIDDDGLYDSYGSANVKVGLTNLYIEVEMQRISELLGIEGTQGYYRVPVLKLRQGFYLAVIPGLPSLDVQAKLRGILPFITNVTVEVRSYVFLELYDELGNMVDSVFYEVKSLRYQRSIPPLVLAFIDEALNNTELWYETLGLAPWGWSASDNGRVVIDVLAVDDKSIEDLGLTACISSECYNVSLNPHPFMQELLALIVDIDDLTSSVMKELETIGVELNITEYMYTYRIPVYFYQSTPLPLVKGRPISYYAWARDIEGKTSISPIGLIHVHTSKPKARILIIDPHVKLWVMASNARNILENITNSPYSSILYEILGDKEFYGGKLASILKILESAEWFTRYHYWSSILGRDYEFKIVWPSSDLGRVLEEYKPDVIVLSNLYLGVNGSEILNWDLRSLGVLDELVDYVQQHHAGLVVTHGTLSDLYIWYDTGEYYKVGSRGHVGYNISDIGLLSDDFVEEKVVSGMVGLRWLPLFEDARDRIAYTLCILGESISKTNPTLGYTVKAAGLAVGSTPLQIPFTPWDGVLNPGPDSMELGLTTTLLVKIPNPYQEVNETYRAYTQFGWQLGSVKVLYNVLLRRLNSTSSLIGGLYGNLSQLIADLVGSRSIDLGKRIRDSINVRLPGLVNALSELRLSGNRIVVGDTPEFKLVEELTGMKPIVEVDLRGRLRELLLRYYPVKLFAISPDGLAGVVGYDKFWDSDRGYRSVYFSFEVEACTTYDCLLLLREAVEWARSWRYVDVLEVVEGLLVNKSSKAWSMLRELSRAPGYTISTLIGSNSTLSLALDKEASKIKLLVYSPTGVEDLVFNPKPSKVSVLDNYTVIVEYTKPIADVELSSASGVLVQPLLVRVAYTYTTTPTTTTTTETPTTATPLTKYVYITITTTTVKTITIGYTTTETKTIRQVETETKTLTTTIPVTTTTTVYEETTTTVTSTKTTITTHTTTLKTVDYSLTLIAAIVAFAAGFIVAFVARRRR